MSNMVIRSLSMIIAADRPEVHESHEPNGGRAQSSEQAIYLTFTDGALITPEVKHPLIASLTSIVPRTDLRGCTD